MQIRGQRCAENGEWIVYSWLLLSTFSLLKARHNCFRPQQFSNCWWFVLKCYFNLLSSLWTRAQMWNCLRFSYSRHCHKHRWLTGFPLGICHNTRALFVSRWLTAAIANRLWYVFGAITDSQQKVRHKVVIYTFYRKLSASVSRTFFMGQDESKTTVLYCPNHHHGSEISEKSDRASHVLWSKILEVFTLAATKPFRFLLLRFNCKTDLGYIFLTLVLDISVNISHGRAVSRWRVGPVSATSPKAYSLADGMRFFRNE